jgi:ricin-type beta-trefoil lectin protein
MANLRRLTRWSIAVSALALAGSGAVASPALAAPAPATPAPRPVAQTVTPNAAPASVDPASKCYKAGEITLTDGSVMDAQGFGNPAPIDDFNPNGGANQQWAWCQLSNGYDEIVSVYNGQMMCLNVSGGNFTSGTHLVAWPCNTVVTGNEQWRRPENTPDPNFSGFSYLVPAGNFNLCVNVAGGFGSGHLMILFACNAQPNEGFGITGSTALRDRIGMVTNAASFDNYSENPAGSNCNMFTAHWGVGSACGNGLRAEDWCADFDAYVWQQGGQFSFTYGGAAGDINAGAVSFYLYAQHFGTWHSAGSGYKPKPGDVAVYGISFDANGNATFAQHAAMVIGVEPGNAGPDVINGNFADHVLYETNQTSVAGLGLNGYASPKGL